ncbi:MAG: hypothetical protein Q9M39_10455 [Sulfurovum sp.]|nr:hypothetical protein [Sulfurovum sp.]
MKQQKTKIMLAILLIGSISLNATEYKPKDGIISLYGAGGPHTALIKVGKLLQKNRNKSKNKFWSRKKMDGKCSKECRYYLGDIATVYDSFLGKL